MPRWSNSLRRLRRFRRDERGITAVEFAFIAPVLVLLGVGLTEMGRVVNQATTLQKSLRAGALFAARSVFPLSSATKGTAENMIKRGDPTGTGEYLLPGWSDAGANLDISTLSFDLNGTLIPVVRVTATVPFVPMLPGLLPIPSFNLELSHEQAFVGD